MVKSCRSKEVNNMGTYTKQQLVEMWKRPVEKQYNIAISKILEAINNDELRNDGRNDNDK